MGNDNFERANVEEASLAFRRSIYFIRDIKKGSVITKKDIKRIRPGFGLKPKYFDEILGRTLSVDVDAGTAVTWDLIEN